MNYIGVDLGGTKVSAALFDRQGNIVCRNQALLQGRKGPQVGELICNVCRQLFEDASITGQPKSIGICVPGIANNNNFRVWAPNIPGWDSYPLHSELENAFPGSKIKVVSDRDCYILGETWMGVAKGCQNAVFVAVGTGIGAGILIDGHILHGASAITGATGWMALCPPYTNEYDACGCFETYASGTGIALQARKAGMGDDVDARKVFAALQAGDESAKKVIDNAVMYWGMAAANLVSLLNPSMIIWGGGIFGPATDLIPRIYEEACKWAQPISIKQCSFVATALPHDAGLYGAGKCALDISE